MLLDRFLDGELDPDARWAVASHLDDCPDCAAELASRARLRAALRPKLASVTAPPDLRRRIVAELAATPDPPRLVADPPADPAPVPAPTPLAAGGRRPMRLALAAALVAAVFALAIVTAGWLGQNARPDPMVAMASDLAAQHHTFAHDETLLDVRGSDAQVAAWLDKELGFQVRTPALPGYELAGARLVTIGSAPAAQIVYERPETNGPSAYASLVLFDPNGNAGPTLDTYAAQEDGMSVVAWQAPNCRAALVAELPPGETMTLAKAVWNDV
jgi:anti-sigma factor (TIGR02949 family)